MDTICGVCVRRTDLTGTTDSDIGSSSQSSYYSSRIRYVSANLNTVQLRFKRVGKVILAKLTVLDRVRRVGVGRTNLASGTDGYVSPGRQGSYYRCSGRLISVSVQVIKLGL